MGNEDWGGNHDKISSHTNSRKLLLARRAIVRYCHTNASGVRRLSTPENKYSNIFYKTTGPTVLKFHMEYDLTPGSQNYKIGLGRISKMAAVMKNSKTKKINFFSRTIG